MIVQPDFLEHWKTLHLIELTGDESAPLSILRFWSHCQHQKRGEFPGMTPAQLATICRWGDRKPACHIALVKAGFVEKLKPKGFAAHEWSEHNRQLLQKWEAGKKGGRPPKDEIANETGDSEKPTGYRPLTDREPGRNPIDKRRTDRPEVIDERGPEPTESPDSGAVGDSLSDSGNGSVGGLVGGLVKNLKQSPGRRYSKDEIAAYFMTRKPMLTKYAGNCFRALEKQGWRYKDGEIIEHPLQWSEQYAEGCLRNDAKPATPKGKLQPEYENAW